MLPAIASGNSWLTLSNVFKTAADWKAGSCEGARAVGGGADLAQEGAGVVAPVRGVVLRAGWRGHVVSGPWRQGVTAWTKVQL